MEPQGAGASVTQHLHTASIATARNGHTGVRAGEIVIPQNRGYAHGVIASARGRGVCVCVCVSARARSQERVRTSESERESERERDTEDGISAKDAAKRLGLRFRLRASKMVWPWIPPKMA